MLWNTTYIIGARESGADLQALFLLRQVVIRRRPEFRRVQLEVRLRHQAEQSLQLCDVLLDTHAHRGGHREVEQKNILLFKRIKYINKQVHH